MTDCPLNFFFEKAWKINIFISIYMVVKDRTQNGPFITGHADCIFILHAFNVQSNKKDLLNKVTQYINNKSLVPLKDTVLCRSKAWYLIYN